jgi:hypothetical protein
VMLMISLSVRSLITRPSKSATYSGFFISTKVGSELTASENGLTSFLPEDFGSLSNELYLCYSSDFRREPRSSPLLILLKG